MKISLAIKAGEIALDDQKLKKLKSNLNKSDSAHRWVPSDLLHISLLSLGEVDTDKIQQIDVLINKILQRHAPFELKLQSIQAYPNQQEGRLLWIGVQNSVSLQALQSELTRELIPQNVYREDKIFKPILPLVRFKNYRNVADMISPYKTTDFGKLKVEQLILIDMISGGAFPHFKVIKSYPLNIKLKRVQPEFNPN